MYMRQTRTDRGGILRLAARHARRAATGTAPTQSLRDGLSVREQLFAVIRRFVPFRQTIITNHVSDAQAVSREDASTSYGLRSGSLSLNAEPSNFSGTGTARVKEGDSP